jgi:L-2,4-diaminobutyrate decarboxylase
MDDPSFALDLDGLRHALDLMAAPGAPQSLPDRLPEVGLGERATLDRLAPTVLGGARRLDGATGFAHMDPPTPWVSWATTLWNAALNQNLLHPDTAPVARDLEAKVIAWLAPLFGMTGGHMCPGSTVANLTALWAAREVKGVRRVVASTAAHLSVPKAAHILGLAYTALEVDEAGRMAMPVDLEELDDSCLVLTAGTTNAGAIDPLGLAGRAAWTHVDAAWAGPLRLSDRYASRLDGVERADSVAISAHKWLFQPKESALVLFRDTDRAHAAVSFGGSYLAVPNVGLLGSHGAVAVPLLATLIAFGRAGVAERIDRAMATAEMLAAGLQADPRVDLFGRPETGLLLWRPADVEMDAVYGRLPEGMTSRTVTSVNMV